MDADQDPPYANVTENISLGLKKWGEWRSANLGDFDFLATIRKDVFYEVLLAEAKVSKKLYAIKTRKKETVIENDEVNFVIAERKALLMATNESHPFVVRMYTTFQTETRLYFVLEYIQGGDLMLHAQRGTFP